MQTPRSLIAVTAVNLALLLFTVAQQLRPAFAQGEPPVLRGRAPPPPLLPPTPPFFPSHFSSITKFFMQKQYSC